MGWLENIFATFYPEQLVLLSLLLPLCVIVVAPLVKRAPNLRDGISLCVALLTFLSVLGVHHAFMAPDATPIKITAFTLLPGLPIAFSVEPVGMLFALVSSFLWIITTLYGIGYMRGNKEAHQTRFFACFALAITCAQGIAFSDNLLTTFVFYEAMTIGTYPLVTHAGTQAARTSGRIYLGILMGTSIGLFLPAILWVYHMTGSVTYADAGMLIGQCSPWIGLLLALFAFGVGKAALMPFHNWLPAAMVAPTPVSALLHAVAVVKAGVFIIVKIILYVFGPDYLIAAGFLHGWTVQWLPYVASITVILGSLLALKQDNLKLRLAYSTIGQLGYITLAASILTPYAIVGAVLHIAAHAFGKITLFFAAGSIYTASKKKLVSQLDGIGHAMPITMTAFSIASLSMIGLPPTVGFLSKWYMVKGMLQAEHWVALTAIAISTLLNAAYLLPIIYRAFFLPLPEKDKSHGEAPWPILIAISCTALGCILLLLFPDLLMDIEGKLLSEEMLRY